MAKFFCTHGEGHTVTVKPEKGTMTYDPRNLTCPTHHKPLLTGMQLNARKPRVATKEGPKRKRSSLKRGKGFAASRAQQDHVRHRDCVACGRGADEYTQIDPAHLYPRSQCPCNHAEGVIPLCRQCHERYDSSLTRASVGLLPKLVDRQLNEEMAHFISAHGISLLTLLQHITGSEWQAVERQLEAV